MPDTGSGSGEGGPSPALLAEVLEEARSAGFLGPGPIDIHLRHAEGFVTLARRQAERQGGPAHPRLLDLGSGGGLPGLVVATRWPEAAVVLLDANQRRTAFLRQAVDRLELDGRVTVVHQRAEESGRDPELRGSFDGVVVRSFGSPAVVAECAAPFLRPGGWLLVSEPPGDPADGAAGDSEVQSGALGAPTRWPAEPLALVGLEPGEYLTEEFGYQFLWQREACPERYPRRNGVPSKHPLF